MKHIWILFFFITIAINLFSQINQTEFESFKKGAEQGNEKAQLSLGILYFNGLGVLKDKNKAAYWIRKSYENGGNKAKDFWEKHELWKYE